MIQEGKKKSLAAIFNVTGALILIILMAVCIPCTIPKLFGVHIYEVRTGSMEPQYKVGSIVYVKDAQPKDIKIGDVITFSLGTDTDLVLTHRVTDIDEREASYITKGDANSQVDEHPVSFQRLIGKPIFTINYLGAVLAFKNEWIGKIILVSLFALVFVLWRIADRIRRVERN